LPSDESAHREQEYRQIDFPEEGYNAYRWKVGGKEPDGKPTRIGKWSVRTVEKPTYILTREHGVRDYHDQMQQA